MDKTKVLVVYISFGNLDTVKQALPSIIDEVKGFDARLIIHDSGTQNRDEVWNYLGRLSLDNPVITLLLTSSLSFAHSVNMCVQLGLELYAPDYILLMEDDHGLNKGSLEAMVNASNKYYGKRSDNGLLFGSFTVCNICTNAIFSYLDTDDKGNILEYPHPSSDQVAMGSVNSCCMFMPTSHWLNVCGKFDTDEYPTSTYSVIGVRWRHYFKGFTIVFVGGGKLGFMITRVGRGESDDEPRLWDNNFCASDFRSRYRGKK